VNRRATPGTHPPAPRPSKTTATSITSLPYDSTGSLSYLFFFLRYISRNPPSHLPFRNLSIFETQRWTTNQTCITVPQWITAWPSPLPRVAASRFSAMTEHRGSLGYRKRPLQRPRSTHFPQRPRHRQTTISVRIYSEPTPPAAAVPLVHPSPLPHPSPAPRPVSTPRALPDRPRSTSLPRRSSSRYQKAPTTHPSPAPRPVPSPRALSRRPRSTSPHRRSSSRYQKTPTTHPSPAPRPVSSPRALSHRSRSTFPHPRSSSRYQKAPTTTRRSPSVRSKALSSSMAAYRLRLPTPRQSPPRRLPKSHRQEQQPPPP
jgi:hypothetical protein